MAEAEGDWVAPQLRIPTGTDQLKRGAAAMLVLANKARLSSAREQRIKDLLDRVRAVAVSGASLSLDPGDGPEIYTALMRSTP